MLDANLITFSFNAKAKEKITKIEKALIIKSCRVYIFSQDRIYSEFDEMSFNYLNNNDYGFGTLQIEIVFLNGITSNPYPDFFTKCVVIRTNNGLIIKPMKFSNEKSYSKVDEEGNLIIGISYFFQAINEISMIKECASILVEGFISLERHRNVYGVMCQVSKIEDQKWEIDSAYTYKPSYAKNIKNLIDWLTLIK